MFEITVLLAGILFVLVAIWLIVSIYIGAKCGAAFSNWINRKLEK